MKLNIYEKGDDLPHIKGEHRFQYEVAVSLGSAFEIIDFLNRV